jgi:hypothetical protein
VSREAIGERFVPWRRFKTYYLIPDPVMAADISPGAKLCWGVLARFAGKDGRCFPTMQTIGRQIGVSERQAKSYIAELTRERYIVRTRGGSRRSNQYSFLWHSTFEVADGQDASQQTGKILPTEESHTKEELHDLDYLPMNRKMRDSRPASTFTDLDQEWKGISDLVEGLLEETPTQSCLGRIVSATPNKTDAEAVEAVQEAILRGYGKNGKKGPRSGSWFVSVVRNYWEDRERRAMPPPASNGGERADFNRMVAAIELPDAESG